MFLSARGLRELGRDATLDGRAAQRRGRRRRGAKPLRGAQGELVRGGQFFGDTWGDGGWGMGVGLGAEVLIELERSGKNGWMKKNAKIWPEGLVA